MLEVAVLAHGACVFVCKPMHSFRRARLQDRLRKLDGRSCATIPRTRERNGCVEVWNRGELRSLAITGGIRAKIGDRWLPVAQLRSALMEALAPTEQAQALCSDRGRDIFKQ